MSRIYKIIVVVGSLRKASFNLKLARAVIKQFPPEFSFEFASLGDIPLYNQDLDNSMPAAAVKLKQQIVASDGMLIVTPEHNRSIPAALKNAIDWGTRPPGRNSLTGKPSGIMGISPSAVGTGIGQQHLRTILAAEGSPTFTTPEVFLQWKEGLIDDQDVIADETTRQFLQGWANAYVKWIITLA
jgi:chromate reductase